MRRSAKKMSNFQKKGQATVLDRMYEHISLPSELVSVMDTQGFQRLRTLRQLGVSHYLYPGATHTRFEHSIGVSYLSRIMMNGILERQGEQLGASKEDSMLVQLAGLAHDLGHGPFSHLFEDVVVNQLGMEGFCHETMSEQIFTRMFLEVPGATKPPVLKGMLNESEVQDVLSLISGERSTKRYPKSKLVLDDRKSWIYEIVANKSNGIDVDKMDYLMRDAMCCFGKPTSDVRPARLFSGARVIDKPGTDGKETTIAYASKMTITLRDLFSLRAKLHKSVYQHRVTKGVGLMIGDVFRSAAACEKPGISSASQGADRLAFPLIYGPDVANPEHFTTLGDWIYDAMASCKDLEGSEARFIIERINRRQLYPMVFEANLKSMRLIREELKNLGLQEDAATLREVKSGKKLSEDLNRFLIENQKTVPTMIFDKNNRRPLVLEVFSIHHGMKEHDPLSKIRFYDKSNKDVPLEPESLLTQSSSLFHPGEFEESTLAIFSRETAKGVAESSSAEISEVKSLVRRFMSEHPLWSRLLGAVAP